VLLNRTCAMQVQSDCKSAGTAEFRFNQRFSITYPLLRKLAQVRVWLLGDRLPELFPVYLAPARLVALLAYPAGLRGPRIRP